MSNRQVDSVTIRPARGGYIVEAQWPWVPNLDNQLTVSSRNIPTVAGNLSSALERAARLLGGRVSVSEEPGLALAEEPEDLFDRGGGSPGMQFL